MIEFEWFWLWLVLMGLGTGVYGVLIGAGGGIILSPLLLIFFHKDPEVVAGTVLALVAINSIPSAVTFRQMGAVDKRSAYLFAMAAIPGSVVAPFFLKGLVKSSPGIFFILFGSLLILLAILILTKQGRYGPRNTSDQGREEMEPAMKSDTMLVRSRAITLSGGATYTYQFNEGIATVINFALGFVSSFFGTGGGFLRTPILVYAFGFPVRVAVATSIFALAFYTSAGALTHALWFGNVEWFPTLIFAGIGLVIGGQIGARLSGIVRGPWIMRLLLVVVFALGIRLVIQGLQA